MSGIAAAVHGRRAVGFVIDDPDFIAHHRKPVHLPRNSFAIDGTGQRHFGAARRAEQRREIGMAQSVEGFVAHLVLLRLR